MRRRLARGVAIGVASGALLLAPMAAAASASVYTPGGLLYEIDWTGPGATSGGDRAADGAPLSE